MTTHVLKSAYAAMTDADRIIEYEHLFYLAAEDIVFFSFYNEEVEDYDGWFHAAVNVNDTFYYASADAEDLAPGKAAIVRDYYERYGWGGVVAWAAIKRGQEPLPPLRTPEYHQAWAELKKSLDK